MLCGRHFQHTANDNLGLLHDALGVTFFAQIKDQLLNHVAVDIPEHYVTQFVTNTTHIQFQCSICGRFHILLCFFLKEKL